MSGWSCWCLFLWRIVTCMGHKEGFVISGGNPAGFLLMLDHVRGSTLSDGQILSSEGASACVCVDWFPEIEIVWVCPFCYFFRKQPLGMNTSVTGTCVQDCTQYVQVASVLGEVQECEIRRWFVEGDNEQSAILTGWALSCKLQSCYTLSDFNHFKLFFLIIPKESLMSYFSSMKIDSRAFPFWSLWKKKQSLRQ